MPAVCSCGLGQYFGCGPAAPSVQRHTATRQPSKPYGPQSPTPVAVPWLERIPTPSCKAKPPAICTSCLWRGTLDVPKMNQAATLLCHYRAFKAFCKKQPLGQSTLCTVMEAKWHIQPGQLLFRIQANRFLRGMLRIIVQSPAKNRPRETFPSCL